MKPQSQKQYYLSSPSNAGNPPSCEKLGLRATRWILHLFAVILMTVSTSAQSPLPAPPVLLVNPEKITSNIDNPTSPSTKANNASLAIPLHTIVIDPGHGGRDTGVRGDSGLLEKEVTLLTAVKVAKLIKGKLGARVILTRSEDLSLPLLERTAIVNRTKGQLFLSLHAEGSFQRESSGFRIFILKPASKSGKRLTPSEENRNLQTPQWDLAQDIHRMEALRLGKLLRQALTRETGLAANPVQETQSMVLKGAKAPAVLISLGHLTNLREEALLERNEFLGKIAEAIFQAVIAFLEGKQNSNNLR